MSTDTLLRQFCTASYSDTQGYSSIQSEKNLIPFMKSLRTVTSLMDDLNISRDNWMVISGGAVSLYQLVHGILDRVPTDLDILVWHHNDEDGDAKLRQIYETIQQRGNTIHRFLINASSAAPHGFTFLTPLVEVEGDAMSPIDILTRMTTIFPANGAIKKIAGKPHKFPTHNKEVFAHATRIDTPIGDIFLAPPAFITFYKLTMARNGWGKQDACDIDRLRNMGYFDNQISIYLQLLQLSNHNYDLTQELMSKIYLPCFMEN